MSVEHSFSWRNLLLFRSSLEGDVHTAGVYDGQGELKARDIDSGIRFRDWNNRELNSPRGPSGGWKADSPIERKNQSGIRVKTTPQIECQMRATRGRGGSST